MSRPASFSTRRSDVPGGRVVVAEGELDIAGVDELVAAVERAAAEPGDGAVVVVDMSGVAFMDSSGLRSLLDAERACAERSRPFALASPTAAVSRVLEVVDLAGRFAVLDDLSPQALSSVTDRLR